MDAVERLLTSPSSPTIDSLIADLVIQIREAANDCDINAEKNRIAWNALVTDERFVRTDHFPANQQQAIEALDPWLRAELECADKSEPKNVLCLAAGGGSHGPLLAMAGALVTVIDFSSKQLAIDQAIASQLGLSLKTIKASIEDLSGLVAQSFDIVIQPVSMCYIRDVRSIYQEVARITRPYGLYVAQHKQAAAAQASLDWTEGHGYVIATPAEDGRKAPEVLGRSPFREHGTTEYIHSVGTLLGGLCNSGFSIEDVTEPPRADAWAPINTFGHRSRYLPPYIKVKARRKS